MEIINVLKEMKKKGEGKKEEENNDIFQNFIEMARLPGLDLSGIVPKNDRHLHFF